MKKAVIKTGGKQYVVTEGETLNIERIVGDAKKIEFKPLLVIDGEKITIGTPEVKTAVVKADILDEIKNDKVTSIRYKAKKRVKKVHGHRQIQTQIKIKSIA